jgi:DNA-binding NtrC family response regulator
MAGILIVDDERAITDAFARFFDAQGEHTVACAYTGAEAIERYLASRPDIVLLDLNLPDMSGFDVFERLRPHNPVVIMITGHGDVPLAVEALQNGAENFLTKPVELKHLAAAVERASEKVRLRQLNRYLIDRRAAAPTALGVSPLMRELSTQIELLASSDKTTVLILGESGSGKGRVAEMIHAASPRAAQPFVEINCAGLTATSLDAELFGVEQRGQNGDGTVMRPGVLEIAHRGTLFLDEIGDLDAQLQPKLLRVLEGKSFRRVGGTQEMMVDVRLMASTNKDLVAAVTAGRFREDLYYRLSVMPLYLPPLRSRTREDAVELIGSIIDDLHPQLPAGPREIADDALDRLLRYPWPGNIRELRNVLERAMIVARGGARLELAHLPSEVRGLAGGGGDPHVARSLDEVERVHIERTLRAHAHNRTHAARELGISRATLIKKIKEYGLNARTK